MAGQEELTLGQKLARDAVDGLLKQASNSARDQVQQGDISLDPETQRKIIEREVKRAADPDYDLIENAKELANERMRKRLDGREAAEPADKREPEKDKAKVNQEIGQTAKAMLDMGIPPQVVAQYLTGASVPAIPINLGGGSNGLTMKDFIELLGIMNANRGSGDLERVLQEMREDIKTLKAEKHNPPVSSSPTSALSQLKEIRDALVDLGMVQRPGTETRLDGEPIEVVKEKHRHEEKMKEIEIDQEHKKNQHELLSSLPERIGEGLANRMLQTEQGNVVKKSGSTEYYNCTNKLDDGSTCNTRIEIPQGASVIQCPKCGKAYGKGA